MPNAGDCFDVEGAVYVYAGNGKALYITNGNGQLVIEECSLPEDAVPIDLNSIDSVDTYLYALIAHKTAQMVEQCHKQEGTQPP